MNKIDSFRGQNYYLSNFYERPVTYDGITYKNNEATFQAQKCISYEDRKRFSDLNASEAKRLGRKVSLRPDWESIKVDVMTNIVHAKFEQNKDLAEKLCNTDTAFLEEGNTWGDRIWGTVNGNGKNLLGHILMSERDYLKEQIREKGYPPSIREICAALNFKSTSSVHQYIARLAEKGYIDKGDLKTRAIKIVGDEPTISIPIVGKVAAGEPILAQENIEDYFSIGESFFSQSDLKNETFVLKVQGESMINAGINNGDYIIVSKENTARNGQIVVAMIDGNATVKTFYKEKDHVRLQPENDTMEPIIVKDVQIVGKVVGLFRKI